MNRIAVVTGASSGIGKGVAAALVTQGWTVHGIARTVDTMPIGVIPHGVDLAELDSIAAVPIDWHEIGLVVHSAGYGRFAPVELTPTAEARRQLQVNVLSGVDVIQCVLPGMRERGAGRIVAVSSIAAEFSSPMAAWYHASKAALEGMLDALRLEVAPFGIDVISVQPGPVRTDWHVRAMGKLSTVTTGTPYAVMARSVADYHQRAAASPMVSDLDDVVAAVLAAATDPQPRPRWVVGRGSRFAVALSRHLPQPAFDALTRRQFGLPVGLTQSTPS